ncbi:mevalonate kinase [Actinomadura rubteroloni]|uniref:phosphomevalonate kinase n=1 Tax=Actinomadura rubteroloni TaxID=1926885 RepID=A0A2P4UEU7_9ACTN|nr:phosphomevalonate kinase [Actinomadura rubteroloni]POM23587.1 mevalonate kinase [Actinomadura rubteroloni]
MITFRAPGKLFVAGEYAVVEPGVPAVLVAVDRHATVTVEDAGGPTVLTSDLDGGSALRRDRADPQVAARFSFALAAVDVVERLAVEHGRRPRPFRLSIRTDLTAPDGRKLGLGSSAAVTVATCGALARFYELRLSRPDLYRVALLATRAVAPAGSGGDVAAAVFGGWLFYCSPDRARSPALRDVAAAGVSAALGETWHGLVVRPLRPPPDTRLEVGWTGRPASTHRMVGRIDRERRRAHGFEEFTAASAGCVSRLAASLERGHIERTQQEIRRARDLLRDLDAALSLGWMTPRLHALCAAAEAIGAAAKPSGAGGGDCGVALVGPAQEPRVKELRERWIEAGIVPLDLRPRLAVPEGT